MKIRAVLLTLLTTGMLYGMYYLQNFVEVTYPRLQFPWWYEPTSILIFIVFFFCLILTMILWFEEDGIRSKRR
jgi:hypothetical protein